MNMVGRDFSFERRASNGAVGMPVQPLRPMRFRRGTERQRKSASDFSIENNYTISLTTVPSFPAQSNK